MIRNLGKVILKESKAIDLPNEYLTDITQNSIEDTISKTLLCLLAEITVNLNTVGRIVTSLVKNKPTSLQVILPIVKKRNYRPLALITKIMRFINSAATERQRSLIRS